MRRVTITLYYDLDDTTAIENLNKFLSTHNVDNEGFEPVSCDVCSAKYDKVTPCDGDLTPLGDDWHEHVEMWVCEKCLAGTTKN